MNTTDERRFRLDLAQALDASAHDIAPLDTAALVGAGARRVRRRRVAGGAATMVGVLTLGGGSWALVNAPGRSQVAAPAPTASPAVAPSASPTDSVGADPEAPVETGQEYVVRHFPGDPAPLALYSIVNGVEDLMGRAAMPVPGRAVIVSSATDPTAVVVVVPAEARRIGLLETGRAGGFSGGSDLAPVPGTALKFGVLLMDADPTDLSALVPMWWRADGTPVTDAEVGAAKKVKLGPDAEVTTWVLPEAARGGITSTEGFGSSTWLRNRDPLTVLTAGSFVADETTTPPTYAAVDVISVVVPGDARDVELTYDPRMVDGVVETIPWPEAGGTLVVARAVLPPQLGAESEMSPGAITGMTWTDAAGVRQEWRNG